MDTHSPFCLVAVGVQGAGKSHTLGVVAEAVLVGGPGEGDVPGAARPVLDSVCRLSAPMCTLVFHYDTDPLTQCELVGLVSPSRRVGAAWPSTQPLPCVPPERVVVLTSPSFYTQRQGTYRHLRTVPLLFDWDALTAEDVKVRGAQFPWLAHGWACE